MRNSWLDSLRGMAVIWMVIFHSAYDMHNFGYNQIDFHHGFWFMFPRLIAGTFLFCVGISLNYVHRPQINWQSLKDRTLKLGACAAIISIVTYFMFPAQWIYFGTLHCILAGSLLGAFLVNQRKLAWSLMVLILIFQYGLNYDIKWVSSTITKKHSMDFIPIYPWLWVVLAGMLLEPYLVKIPLLQKLPPSKSLHFLGRHSLKIYLIHQPIIFGALSLANLF
jgi:uncharacterized membrane protein